jgi:hypothetical protein
MRERGIDIPMKRWSAAAIVTIARKNATEVKRKIHFN